MNPLRVNGTNRASYQASMQQQLVIEAAHEAPVDDDGFQMIREEHRDDSWLLNGEEIQKYEYCAYLSPGKGKIHGLVTITNYRLKFQPDDSVGDVDFSFELPLGLINGIEKFGFSKVSRGEDSYGIKISCKDMRTIKFIHDRETKNRKILFEALVVNAFPNSNQKPFFATVYREPFRHNGWDIYDPVTEYKRLGVPNDIWSITDMNLEYKFIPTYPKLLVFPTEALKEGEAFLKKVVKFRSSGRIPTLVWYNPETTASITRSSQPMSGLMFKTSSADERFVQMIWHANKNCQSNRLKIFDARPTSNAQANRLRGGGYETSYPNADLIFLNIHSIHAIPNRLRGGGYETSYPNADLIFLNIHSIHAIRKSIKKLRAVCYPKGKDNTVVGVENLRWMAHLQVIVNGAHAIVKEVVEKQNNVLIHCSDGWDRTSQLSSLSMILIDPFYRSLRGFAILIEKEWLSFGHKFATRFGHGVDNPKSDERAPIFVQWVDCIWQYICEYPTAFQFNIKLLTTILEEVYSCRFGTFLYNNEREREDQDLKTKTESFWSYVFDNEQEFINPNYKPINNPIMEDEPLKCKVWFEYYCRHNMEGVQKAHVSRESSIHETSEVKTDIPLRPTRRAPAPPSSHENGDRVTRKKLIFLMIFCFLAFTATVCF
uniref:Phosphatidylinositol-3,5-bisphosphate 3-phosphatase n=1 Tax=Panagrolaimus sp. JU765 TaxID=591449 RepID=A0AC34R1T4_9BILA